nr:site-specific integrase [Syntrophaceticus schinkii]
MLPCFTHEEVETILKQIDIDTKEGKRDYAILFLASHTGLRAVDIANLRLTDLDWVNDTICIVQRKTGRLLILPMETDTGNAIAAYILEGRPESDSEHVFLRTMAPYRKLSDVGAVGNILQKYLKKAGLTRSPGDGKSFHGLRRSMGTWMLESGVPLTTISQVLGHKEQDSAKQYLSMDHKRLAECTLDFQGIPIKGGLFL